MNTTETNGKMDMAARHREMIMNVAKTISEELVNAGSEFAMSPGDVLRVAATPIPDQEEILVKYMGEDKAKTVTSVAARLGAKTIAETLDRLNDEWDFKKEDTSIEVKIVEVDLDEALRNLVNDTMDSKKAWTEDDFLAETDAERIVCTFKAFTSSSYLNFYPADEQGSEQYHLTIFNEGDFTDDRMVGSRLEDAYDAFAEHAMFSLLNEKGQMVRDEIAEEQEVDLVIDVQSAVTNVMTKLFNGDFMQKAS